MYKIAVCFCLLSVAGLAQQNDSIIWTTNYKLSYADFKHAPPATSNFKAMSNLNFPFRQKIKGDTMYVFPFCYFKKSESWFKKDSSANNNVVLLSHERGHFDLAEIEIRKLRKKLLEMHLNRQNAESMIKQAATETLAAEQAISDLYDKETNFSTNKEKQKEWEQKIKKQLQELSAYANTVIKVPLKTK